MTKKKSTEENKEGVSFIVEAQRHTAHHGLRHIRCQGRGC